MTTCRNMGVRRIASYDAVRACWRLRMMAFCSFGRLPASVIMSKVLHLRGPYLWKGGAITD
jgi:hypothetical protein